MDIKSKSFKYSYFTKTTAVMLAFALIFISGYAAFSLYRSEVIFADDGNENLASTPTFLYNMLGDFNAIAAYSALSKNLAEDRNAFTADNYYTKTSIDNLNSDRKLAIELFDIIQNFKKLAPENTNSADALPDGEYEKGYDEGFGSEAYTSPKDYDDGFFTEAATYPTRAPADINPSWSSVGITLYNSNSNIRTYYNLTKYTASNLDISEVKNFLNREYKDYDAWYNDYQILRSYIFALVNDARSHSTIDFEFDKKVDNLSQQNWEAYREQYYNYKSRVTSMVNVRFAVVDKKTGEVFTNIEENSLNLDAFKASLADSLFYIDYSAHKGLVGGGFPKRDEATNTIIELFGYTIGSAAADTFSNSYLESNFGDKYDAYIMLPKQLERGDVYHYIYQNYQNINKNQTMSLGAVAFFLLLSVIPTVYLIAITGRKNDETLSLANIDKVPFIIHLALCAAVTIGLLYLAAVLFSFEFNNAFYDTSLYVVLSVVYSAVPVAVGFLLGASYLVMLELTLSFTRLIKAKQFFKNTLLHYIGRLIKLFVRLVTFPFTKTVKRTLAFGVLGFLLADGFTVFLFTACLDAAIAVIAFIFWAVINAAVFIAVIKYVSGIAVIGKLASEIKSGNYGMPLNIGTLPKALRKTAEDMLDVRSSIQLAVNEGLKGERMKTELITNVSHDLKTPLTSIINYVDLLKKCEIRDEDAAKYLEILDDKSKRLKRLIDDLTEASKASTGNIKINRVPIDLSELALQALGEHSDVLEAAGLEAVYKTGEVHSLVFADSQHTWRIIDNLFSNVKKYAQPGTRVYIDVYAENGYGVFSMKNVSKNPLNIPVSELTERFVRGDASRAGEGSGLGLSIAQSLCELQGGKFILEIDGDLFKASIKLPLHMQSE